MTFGYNSSFFKANARSSATVLDFAKDLLYDLKYGKDEHREDLNMGNVRFGNTSSRQKLITC